MSIQSITDHSVWQNFFDANYSPSFLQSWEWGNFQKNIGYHIGRFGLEIQKELVAIFQVIKIRSKRGNFLFLPHGPIMKKAAPDMIKKWLREIKDFLVVLAKKENFAFIRIAPILEDKPEERQIFETLGFKQAPIYMHAERVWVLPINRAEEEILSQMRKTTRYLVRKGLREGLYIEKRTDEAAIEDFWPIYMKTAAREKFTPFSKQYIADEFTNFNKTGKAIFLFAKIKNSRPCLAAALILFTQSTAFYHQGASIHSKIPATYLLQWEAIREAKKRGCRFYNFWGIYRENRTPKSWAGLTLFKQGFGGQRIDYLPTYDLALSPKYFVTFLYEKFLNIKRGI